MGPGPWGIFKSEPDGLRTEVRGDRGFHPGGRLARIPFRIGPLWIVIELGWG